MNSWSTPVDVADRVRRRWDDGTLLRGYARRATFPVIEVPLRGPRPSEIGDDLSAVRTWVDDLDAGSRGGRRYTLVRKSVGGRVIGRNELPVRAVVSDYGQAWSLLGTTSTVAAYDRLLSVAEGIPVVLDWVVEHPHRALALGDDLGALIGAYRWLDAHRGSGRYLREISAPGVDTKFAERHRAVLAAMLDVPSSATGFLRGLGLRAKPDLVRLRPAGDLGLPAPVTELGLRAGELARLPVQPHTAVVVENEITYLSVDVPAGGMVVWGKGFDVDRIGRLPWLAETDVVYWGDLDTHGFAILDRLRAWLPQTRSVLMDREALLAHRTRWGREDRPARSVLSRLTEDEQQLYSELVADVWGDRVRLEQERIDWTWAQERLPTA
ncbi:hypothetical protein C6V83_12660 [Gordonia iterans]|uniref:DUF3322 and DUF2220 domain-containing protein n=1 Tax=Gordonia iterans TaxID=1004901 RepID=A0A2S0KH21_9ACTN|nr:DUF3322 and DUF2220 domain-containing protein [Gordonia iterans]AVM00979.1 hypothetical protein C6V83_12660 [Gordonia iterans]